MPAKRRAKSRDRSRQKLNTDSAGDLYADLPSGTVEPTLRVSFRRNWYSPPLNEEGDVDLRAFADELEDEQIGGTIVLREYLEGGVLGYATEIPVSSKDELESVLRTVRKVFKEGVKSANEIRQAALEQCKSRLAELEPTTKLQLERRDNEERRKGDRRARRRSGSRGFWKRDRRGSGDRRMGAERRFA